MMISVRDTGRGIKAENIKKLFTKFERLDIEKNTTININRETYFKRICFFFNLKSFSFKYGK